MRTTVTIDDERYQRALDLADPGMDKGDLFREAMKDIRRSPCHSNRMPSSWLNTSADLLRLHGRDPFTMRQRKQASTRLSAAERGPGFAFGCGLLQFSSSPRVRVQNKPRIPDGTDQRIGRLARDPSCQSLISDRLLAQVPRQSKHHCLGIPRPWRAVLYCTAGPEQAVTLLLREFLLADRQRLSVQVGAGDSLNGDR